jgi:hypothetical protein
MHSISNRNFEIHIFALLTFRRKFQDVTDDNLSVLRGRDLFIKWGSPSARREEPGFFIFPNHIGCDLGLSEGKRGWQRAGSLYFNQITDTGIHIPDIFVVI